MTQVRLDPFAANWPNAATCLVSKPAFKVLFHPNPWPTEPESVPCPGRVANGTCCRGRESIATAALAARRLYSNIGAYYHTEFVVFACMTTTNFTLHNPWLSPSAQITWQVVDLLIRASPMSKTRIWVPSRRRTRLIVWLYTQLAWIAWVAYF